MVRLKILGSGQDGGIPHTGCHCVVCRKARQDPNYRRLGPSVAIFGQRDRFCYLIDVSPDFKYQLDMIHEHLQDTKRRGKIPINGILLTHAHFGHIAGLWHLGKEVVDEDDLPVFTTLKMSQFLQESCPFSLLIRNRNIKIEEIHPQKRFELDGVNVLPIEVPHRNEIGDTIAYVVESKKRILYMPDIDRWTRPLMEEIGNCDIAFIDGTFYSKEEVTRFEEVPHPPMQETIKHLENVGTEIYFVHLNHTNPVNRKGRERKYVESKGFKIANDGMMILV